MNLFLSEAQGFFDYARNLRRDFHRFPELGFQEERTSAVVAKELKALDLDVRTGIAGTGVVAMIEGTRPGSVVLLRFDMDALPITEKNGVDYASQNPGVMHACGHDGHTAIGLTAARILAGKRSELKGSVKLVFQPAEEGLGGAAQMVAEGVLERPRPDFALGLHLWNEMPVGWLGVTSGPVMAASDVFEIEVRGRGGHGALPHLAADPLLASAQMVISLQSIVSRNVSPLDSAVVSVTMLHGGDAFNVIPDVVKLKGTIRTFEPALRKVVVERFEQVVHGTASTFNCEARLILKSITPAVVNDPQVVSTVRETAQQVFPASSIDGDYRTMGSEDMAFFLKDTPGCFFLIGSANSEKGLDSPHHHPTFDFDESVLSIGSAIIAGASVALLNREI
jgi:amidohydrolase